MQLINHNGKAIRYYAALDEFPAERRSWLTKYQLESIEFPKTPAELVDKFSSIMGFYNSGEIEHGNNAIQNLVMGIQAIWADYTPDELSFGVLIHDIDGIANTDMSEDGLRSLMRTLHLPIGIIRHIVEDVKKNSEPAETSISLGLLTMPE